MSVHDDLPVAMDLPDARPAIELVHETLSTGETIVYHPDWNGEPTEWIRSDVHQDARRAR